MTNTKSFINRFLTLVLLVVITACVTVKPKIDQSKGVDSSVDYKSLTRYGPWDDENYNLTSADIKLLAPNEEELKDPIPAFFRVMLRKNYPNLPRTGPAQYPRSALQIYLKQYGGYTVNGKKFNKLELQENVYKFIKKEPKLKYSSGATRFLIGEIRVTSPPPCDESAVKVSPTDPDIIVAGTNGPGYRQTMHYSSDGGETWTRSDLPLGNTCCDPTVDWSSDGGFVYTATLGNCGASGCAVWFYRSGDNGQTWTDLENDTPGDPRRELTTSGSDKEFLHVDKHLSSPHRDNVYLTWHDGNVLQFARSTNFGNTWTTTSFSSDPLGIGSDIVTDRTGNIYYFYPATNTRQILLKQSTNGGVSFQTGTIQVATTNGDFDFPIPSMETRRAWIYVSADADLSSGSFGGSVYASWTDTYAADSESNSSLNHTRIQVAYSRDGGNTWTVVTPHQTSDQNTVDRWNQWIAVGLDGTVHLIFYDTRNSVNRSGVDLYYCYSTDGAQTFSTPERLSSVTSTNLSDAQEFGDYNGLDNVVRQVATFADNRLETAGTGDSKDVYAVSNPLAEEWRPISSGTTEDLYTMHFPSNNIGYAAGGHGTILKTTDAGNTWFLSNTGIPASAYIYSIFFTDNNTGYAVGNVGNSFTTSNGGNSWTSFNITSSNIRNVFFINNNKGFIVADGALFRTTNSGTTWQDVTSLLPSGTAATDLISSEIFFRDSDNGFILMQSKVLKTTNGGDSWISINTPGLATYDIDFVNSNIGFICGIGTGLLTTSDGGNTWNKVNTFTSNTPMTVYFRDVNNGIIAGRYGEIFVTENGGVSWTVDDSNTDKDIHKVLFNSGSGEYIAVGKDGVIIKR